MGERYEKLTRYAHAFNVGVERAVLVDKTLVPLLPGLDPVTDLCTQDEMVVRRAPKLICQGTK